MALRKGSAQWNGTLREGHGSLTAASGAFNLPYSFKSRFEEEAAKTNPEELIGAAHAGCFAMFLSAQLTNAGFPPNSINATADVELSRDDIGPVVKGISINVEASVPNVDQAKFDELVGVSKERCPISRALAAVPLTVSAKLI